MSQSTIAQRKRSSKLLSIVLIAAVLVSVGVVSYLILTPSLLDKQFALELQEFSRFTEKYGKKYSTQEEFDYRFKVYRDNLGLIRIHNSLDSDVKLAVNKFADLTQEEFKNLYTSEIKKKPKNYPEFSDFDDVDFDAVPQTVDWRDKGAVTDVINQTPFCKAGWAISSVGAVEGIWKIKGHELPDLSIQQVIDCQNTTTDPSCYGGLNDDDAFIYIEKNGLSSDISYPYTHTNGTCKTGGEVVATITNYTDAGTLAVQDMYTAVAMQPVVAAVESDKYVWQFYSSGVIYRYCGSEVNHYVLVVGYNLTGSYYTVKNSWGADWGESGYVRIGSGSGTGACGIQTLVAYPNIFPSP